jgi:hypothetical protein
MRGSKMSDAEALKRVIALVDARDDGSAARTSGDTASAEWLREHVGTLWVLEGLLEALENDDEREGV